MSPADQFERAQARLAEWNSSEQTEAMTARLEALRLSVDMWIEGECKQCVLDRAAEFSNFVRFGMLMESKPQ